MNFASRPPIPQGAPPPYAVVNRVYRKSLRPVVAFTAATAALWCLASAAGAFRAFSYDKDNVHSLAPYALAIGILYLVALVIELFGVYAALTQKIPLVRIYALASVLSALAVIATSFLETVTHFTFKNTLIDECTDLSTGDVVYSGWGFWGPTSTTTLDQAQANQFCQSAWNHDSWAEIVSLLITIVLAGMFTMIAFAYYRQLVDPSSMRLAPSQAYAPSHYNPPYASSAPELGYGEAPAYAPPPGAPPAQYGYGAGAGAGDAKSEESPGFGKSEEDVSDPFEDFEPVPDAERERNVTSGPKPGGSEGFSV